MKHDPSATAVHSQCDSTRYIASAEKYRIFAYRKLRRTVSPQRRTLMSIKSVGSAASSAARSVDICTRDNAAISAAIASIAFVHWRDRIRALSVGRTAQRPSTTTDPRNHHQTITPTSPNPQLQLTPSFAPAATPCEFHPTSAHPPHSNSHHRDCCRPARLTLLPPESMVHA